MRCMCGGAKLRAETNQPQLCRASRGSMGRAGGQAGGQMNIRGTWHMEHGAPTAAGLGPSPLITRPGLLCGVWMDAFVTGNILRFKGLETELLFNLGAWIGRCVPGASLGGAKQEKTNPVGREEDAGGYCCCTPWCNNIEPCWVQPGARPPTPSFAPSFPLPTRVHHHPVLQVRAYLPA